MQEKKAQHLPNPQKTGEYARRRWLVKKNPYPD